MAQFPSNSSAYGIWSLSDQRDAVRGGNWPSLPVPVLDYLIVAGGGGGGSNGGGGGAGGYLYSTSQELSTGTYIVTVGAGGTGGPSTGDVAWGANGNDSEFNSETAIGGGGGGGGNTPSLTTYRSGRDGGSGGGGAAWYGNGTGGSGTAGQGNSGGGGIDSPPYMHGGGGGAGAAGAAGNAVVGYGGDGGDGLQNSITGSATYYAGGGGGAASYSTTDVGSGGLGGGGDAVSGDGSVNTGGGGGGGSDSSTREGGDGGSGVVILRTTSTASGTTGSPTVTTDGSYNIYTFTGSGTITFGPPPPNNSVYFDGSGDYLASASTSDLAFGTGDWTIECWVYPTASPSNMRLWNFSGSQDNGDLNVGSTGTLNYYNGSVSTTSTGGLVPVNQWTHIAIVRSSGTVKGYVNGVEALSQSTTPNTTSAREIYIGGNVNTLFNGYMSNFRIVKGTAVYTSNFSVPTSNLTAITGTVLLTCQEDNIFTDGSGVSTGLTVNGNLTASTETPF